MDTILASRNELSLCMIHRSVQIRYGRQSVSRGGMHNARPIGILLYVCPDRVSQQSVQESTSHGAMTDQGAPPTPPATVLPPECPCVRYSPYHLLPGGIRRHANALGYTEATWNRPSSMRNSVEQLYYDALTSRQQAAARSLGYRRHTWTCCANHYTYHHWNHMGSWYPMAKQAYEALGWTMEQWNRDQDYPASAYKVWCRNLTGADEGTCLTEEETAALRTVCYTPSSYRGESLIRPLFEPYEVPAHCQDYVAGLREDEAWDRDPVAMVAEAQAAAAAEGGGRGGPALQPGQVPLVVGGAAVVLVLAVAGGAIWTRKRRRGGEEAGAVSS